MFQVPLQAIFISIAIHSLWGGNPIAGKLALEVFPPFWSAFFRFVCGVITIFLWCRFRGHKLWPEPQEWRPLLWIGALFTLQIGLMNLGFDRTSGVNASILISVNPLFAALTAHWLLGNDRVTGLRLCGLVAAFAGVVLTIWFSSQASAGAQSNFEGVGFGNAGDWLCLASAALLGFRLMASAKAMRSLDPFRLAVWQMLFSLPAFALAGSVFETIRWQQLDSVAVMGIVYQGVVVAGVGFMVSLWLISKYRPSVMASFNFISPVSGVFLAAVLLKDTVTWPVLMAVALVAVGMLLINLRSAEA